jgi:transposase
MSRVIADHVAREGKPAGSAGRQFAQKFHAVLEDTMTLRDHVYAMKLMGQSNAKIAEAVGRSEGAVRYHLRRHGRADQRKNRHRKLDALAAEIEQWIVARYPLTDLHGAERPVDVSALYDWLRREHAYEGSHKSVARYLKHHYPRLRLRRGRGVPQPVSDQSVADGFGPAWVLRLLLGKEPLAAVREAVLDCPDLALLYRAVREGGCKRRKQALVVLGCLRGVSLREVARTLQLNWRTATRYWETYRAGGVAKLFERPRYAGAKSRNEQIKAAVIALLHSPPSTHGINRTSWKMDDLRKVLRGQGVSLGADAVRKIIKAAGFRWRKARVVLTSNDPHYREKVDRIKAILAALGPKERFFSIDEFGPFAVQITGGRVLCDPKNPPVVPQYQKSKGSLIVTAALELSTNQVTHFFSPAKNTEEMVKLLDALLTNHADCERLYLSWDAASWHDSHRFLDRVAEVNTEEYRAAHHTPQVELVPLPSRAQFLNVIESVFSGMARAIIHNSDYESVEAAKAAIDRYFRERNDYFLKHPRRAGKKIWGQERVPCQFSEANSCKDPLYRR